MTLTVGMVTVDATDARALAAWWAEQLGGRLVDEAGGWFLQVLPPPGAPGVVLGFQKVTDPTPGKNRIHLDLETSDRAVEVERLVSNGARLVAEHTVPGFRWSVLADPAGNLFDVGAADETATEVS